MHEMSLVISILDIAESQAREANAAVINSITVELGQLAGVEKQSLAFCFETARRDTLAADGQLIIEEIPGRGHCPVCDREGPAEDFVAVCSFCSDGVLEINQGRELRVRSINVD